MQRQLRFALIAVCLLVTILSAETGHAQALPPTPESSTQLAPDFSKLIPLACDPDGVQASGAVYRICMPFLWNGDLLVYAHGYVSPQRPVGIPEDQLSLPGGPSLPDVANLLGYAFAVTSYSDNGLAVQPALADLVDLVNLFIQAKGPPRRVLLVGVSEGGLITTLAMERRPDVFAGGLALCGPYGSFQGQIDHFGDGRVVFDYFFPALLPPSPIAIPPDLMASWDNTYTTTVQPALLDPANAGKVEQYLAVTRSPFDAADASTKEATIRQMLWYNVMATNDGRDKLGGQPYDNQRRTFTGSADDAALNQQVQRFSGDPAAQATIAADYETTGKLARPLLTMHTTGDPIVPYWHLARYQAKTYRADNIALNEARTVTRYGHCSFSSVEVLGAFNRLRELVDNPPPYQPVQRLFFPALFLAQ